jgi:lysophospholipase L1-like esterase
MKSVNAAAAALISAVMAMTIPMVAEPAASPSPTASQPKPKFDFYAHFQTRCTAIGQQIAALPAGTTATVVLLGDSITEGNRINTLAGMPVINEGVVSDQIALPPGKEGGLVKRIALVGQAKPAHVFVLIGINDLASGKAMDALETQYRQLVAELRKVAPSARLYLQSVLPTRGKYAIHNAKVLTANQKIAAIARENGIAYVDLHSVLKDDKGELREDMTRDGLHLLPAAYDIVNRVLEKQMSK